MRAIENFPPDSLPGRINRRLIEVRLSPRVACKLAGLSDSFIKNIYLGRSQTPRPETLARLAISLKTTREWLLYGDSSEPPNTWADNTNETNQKIPVMVTKLIESGAFYFTGNIADYFKRPHTLIHRQHAFCLFVADGFMEPAYFDGDPIIVDPDRPPAVGDDVVFELQPTAVGKPSRCYLRTLVKRNGTSFIGKQHNPPNEFRYALEDILNMYRVVPRREMLGP